MAEDLDTEGGAPEASTRRETIEAAFAAAEAPEEPAEVVMPEPVEAASSDAPPAAADDKRTAAERARDQAGRFAKGPKNAPKVTVKPTLAKPGVDQKVKSTAAAATSVPTEASKAPVDQQAAPTATLKPPASWKPAARERWATLPPEVQQEAVRRERETQAALNESSEARKNWGSFQQAVAPYAGMIQAEGGNPIAAVGNLLQTAAALRTAPAPTKANIVANLVRTFGIDIQMLDDALAGQAPTQRQPQAQHELRDPRFDELMARIKNGEQQKQQALAQQQAREVETFGANAEFFDDVRADMADILEVAARRGKTLSLEQAYAQAVKLHPEVSEVMAQREKAKAATTSQVATQRARAAASSVKSRPAGPAPTVAPNGRRGAIEAAWESHNR